MLKKFTVEASEALYRTLQSGLTWCKTEYSKLPRFAQRSECGTVSTVFSQETPLIYVGIKQISEHEPPTLIKAFN